MSFLLGIIRNWSLANAFQRFFALISMTGLGASVLCLILGMSGNSWARVQFSFEICVSLFIGSLTLCGLIALWNDMR
jgi:1,4-dihydroxy-2-naphthoate octaprenyltransferase